jgi:dUTPase
MVIMRELKTYLIEENKMEAPVFRFALRADLIEDKRFLPTRANLSDLGWDVRSAQVDRKDIVLRAGEYFKIGLGFRAFPPNGWGFQIHPRSSSFAKKSMHCLIGNVDEGYNKWEVMFCGQYLPDINALGRDLVIKFGDPIGQIIPIERIDMRVIESSNEELDRLIEKRNDTRTGGIGSTG